MRVPGRGAWAASPALDPGLPTTGALTALDHFVVAGLALGGLVAAPLGAWLCARLPHRPFLAAVGLLVILLSLRTFLRQ